jgi:hypothetical protein
LLKSEMETNFRILPIYFFFGIQNVRVGGKILGSVGRLETHIFFFWPNILLIFFISLYIWSMFLHHNYSGVEIKNGKYTQVITKTLYCMSNN